MVGQAYKQCFTDLYTKTLLPSNCVLEALHLVGDVLKVPERLAGLLHVGVLELRDHSAPDDLVGVRL